MNLSSVTQAEQARHLLLTKLETSQTPLSLQKLGLSLGSQGNQDGQSQLSNRTLKEAAWRLVEEGKAKFNSTWDLEIS